MKHRDDKRIATEPNAHKDAPRAAFTSLDELRTIIRLAGEWDASLGIPLPKRLTEDLGSKP